MSVKKDNTLILNELKNAFNFKSNVEFAEYLGIKPQTISNWYARNTIDYELIYTKCVGLDANWLLTGKGNMFIETNPKAIVETPEEGVSIYKLKTDYYSVERQKIPLYEIEATAGLNAIFSNQNNQIPLDYITIPNAPVVDGAVFVRGDSMYPILKAGDIVCYKNLFDIENVYYGEMYLLDTVIGDDDFLTFKYVQESPKGDNYFRLVSHNTHHSPKDILKKNVRAMAMVKVSIRYNTIS